MVELAIDNRVLSLSRREPDVALPPARPLEGDLLRAAQPNVQAMRSIVGMAAEAA